MSSAKLTNQLLYDHHVVKLVFCDEDFRAPRLCLNLDGLLVLRKHSVRLVIKGLDFFSLYILNTIFSVPLWISISYNFISVVVFFLDLMDNVKRAAS